MMTGCSSTGNISSDNVYASQQQYLADMAKGIEKRTSNSDGYDSLSGEELATFRAKLVDYELDNIKKYSDSTFEDKTFNALVHSYIHGCEIQKAASEVYKNEELSNSLWDSGYATRASIINELYTRYDLPISSELAESYSIDKNGSYTITTDGDYDISSGLTFYKQNMETKETITIISSEEKVLFNEQNIVISLESIEINENNEINFNFKIKNGSSLSVSCYMGNTYVDDYKVDTYYTYGYDIIAPEKNGFANSSIPEKELRDVEKLTFDEISSNLYIFTVDGTRADYIAKIPMVFKSSAFDR